MHETCSAHRVLKHLLVQAPPVAQPVQEVAQCVEQAEVEEVRQRFVLVAVGFSMF